MYRTLRQRFIQQVLLPVLISLNDESQTKRLNNLSFKSCSKLITIYNNDWKEIATKVSLAASAHFVDALEILYYRAHHGMLQKLELSQNTISQLIGDPKLISYYQIHFGCTLIVENRKRVTCFNEKAAQLLETGKKKMFLSYPQFGEKVGNFFGFTAIIPNVIYVQGYYQIYHTLQNLFDSMSGPTLEMLLPSPQERFKFTVSC